tara:strand:- start:607 stop:1065 length:459 start_codon:yes stop_codon:yes gene_type:complete
MALSFEEINILGNLLNDTYGRSSTSTEYSSEEQGGDLRYGGYTKGGTGTVNTVSTKASLQGDVLCVTSLCIANLGPIGHQQKVIQSSENELNQHINAFMKDLKKDFKKKENAGRALKVKEQKDKRSTDVQGINLYSEARQSYIIRRAYFEIA